MMSMHLRLLLVAALALPGCGTIGTQVKGHYDFRPAEKLGLVAMSTRVVDQCGRVGGLTARMFRGDETTATGTTVIFRNPLLSTDIGDDGYFHVFELPEGDYTLGNVSVTGLTVSARHTSDPAMLNLMVESGRVTYIGEVGLTVSPACRFVSPEVKNMWTRDAGLFTSRVTNIQASEVKIDLAKKAEPPMRSR